MWFWQPSLAYVHNDWLLRVAYLSTANNCIKQILYRLDGRKGAFFLGQGPVQGPQGEVQGPCSRATSQVNGNECKGHLDMCKGHNQRCKGLCCVQGPHLWPIYLITNDKQYNLVQGPQLEVQGPLIGARAIASLFVAHPHGPCPPKMSLFGRLSGIVCLHLWNTAATA